MDRMFTPGFWAVLAWACCGAAFAAETYKLEEPVDDTRVFGVGTRIDVTGRIQPDPKQEALPLAAGAALSYRERRLLGPGSDAESLRSIREYEQTQSTVDVKGQKVTSTLPDNLKLAVAQGQTEGVELYSLGGALTADELDLIRSPADSLALIALLPQQPVSIGDSWTARPWAAQMLASLDAVVKGDLKCTLVSVEKQVARISITGKLEGAALASLSEMTVEGHFEYDLTQRCLSACDFTQVEKRSGGTIKPAFEFTARVRMIRRPAPTPGRLDNPKLIETAGGPTTPASLALRYSSPWNISIEHPRHWHLTLQQDKLAIFRLIDEGNMIAQCNLMPVPPARPGEHLPEAEFLRDIHQSFGDRIKAMGQGEVLPTPDRRFLYRIKATGKESFKERDEDVTWFFYLIADPSGRQASMTTFVTTDQVEILAQRERELIDSMRFGPAPTSPTPRTTSR